MSARWPGALACGAPAAAGLRRCSTLGPLGACICNANAATIARHRATSGHDPITPAPASGRAGGNERLSAAVGTAPPCVPSDPASAARLWMIAPPAPPPFRGEVGRGVSPPSVDALPAASLAQPRPLPLPGGEGRWGVASSEPKPANADRFPREQALLPARAWVPVAGAGSSIAAFGTGLIPGADEQGAATRARPPSAATGGTPHCAPPDPAFNGRCPLTASPAPPPFRAIAYEGCTRSVVMLNSFQHP